MAAVANVAINVDSRGAVGKLREVQNRTSSLDKATQSLTRSLAGLAAGFGATFALGKIINDVAKLDTNLRRLGTVGGDVQGLSKALDQVGENIGGLANKAELAAASYQALSAGFTETAQNARVVETATKAAVGGLVDVTSVVEVTTKTLNAYNMSGDEAVKVTDSISKAIEFGQVQWSDYTSQLGRVASVAATAGVSLDEVNAFIAAATKNGATAEVAFTGLGGTLATLLKPTKETQDAAKALGINWSLAGVQIQGFNGLMAELADAMEENPKLATKLLGAQEAIRGAFAAASKGGSDYREILEGLGGAAGKTESDFEKMKGSLENQLKALNTAFTELGTKLFEVFGPTLTDLIKGTTTALTNAVDAFNSLPEPVKKGTAELVRMIAQLLLVKKAIEGIVALRTVFVAAMVAKAGAIASTGTAAKTSASMFALYTANTKTLQAQAATATPVVRGLLGVLKSLALIGVITVGVDVVVKGIGTLMAANAELAKLRGERAAGGAAATFAGASRETVLEAQKAARQRLADIQAERKRRQSVGGRLQQIGTSLLGPLAPVVGLPSIEEDASKSAVLRAREQKARDILSLPVPAAAKPPAIPTEPFKVGDVIDESTVAGSKVGGGATRTAGGGGRSGPSPEEVLARQTEFGEQLLKQKQRELALTIEQDPLMRELLQISYERADAEERVKDAAAEQRDELLKTIKQVGELKAAFVFGKSLAESLIGTSEQLDRVRSGFLEGAKIDEQLQKANQEADIFKQTMQDVGQIMNGAITSAIDGLISGTADWNNILTGALKQLGSLFINAGLNQWAGPAGSGGILSFLGFGTRATGGPVSPGSTYMVGERGPELLTMTPGGGYVTSNSASQAAMDRYSSGNARGGSISVNYNVTDINGMRFVTEDQFRAGISQAAKQGADGGFNRTMSSLKNSRSTRSRVGV